MNPDSFTNNLTSSEAKFSGEIIASTPNAARSNSLESSINSALLILAIVLFAPRFLDRKQVSKFTDSLAVTPMTKSALETPDFFKVFGDEESPLITFISR